MRIYLLIVVLMVSYGFQGRGQSIITAQDKKTSFPSGTIELTKDAFNKARKDLFNEDSEPRFQHYLRKDNLLVTYADVKELRGTHRTLENRKKEWNFVVGEVGTIKRSEIIQVGNRQYLVVAYSQQIDNFISFWSDYDARNNYQMGRIQFVAADGKKADDYLLEFLNSIK